MIRFDTQEQLRAAIQNAFNCKLEKGAGDDRPWAEFFAEFLVTHYSSVPEVQSPLQTILDLLRHISTLQEILMAQQQQTMLDLSGLKTEMDNLESSITTLQAQQSATNDAITALGTSVSSEIAGVNTAIANLEQQILNGTGITQADLDALKARVATAKGNIDAQVAQVQAAAAAASGDKSALDAETAGLPAGSGSAPAPASSSGPLQPGGPGSPLVHQ